VGCVSGLSIAAAVMQMNLREELRIGLEGIKGREEIVEKALKDIDFVMGLKGNVGEIVTKAYVRCLTYTHGNLKNLMSGLFS
jgi:hypothetical protein